MENTRFLQERKHYPLLQNRAYFETAATGAVPDYVYEAHRQYEQKRYDWGGDSFWRSMDSFSMIEWAKSQLAGLLGCTPCELAFGENASQMFGQFAAGLRLSPGDNVILTDTTFPSMAYAWQLRQQTGGIEVRFARSDKGAVSPADIFALADERTRVISLNHVESNTGFRHDLGEIGAFCRSRGILLAVDAVQSAGVLPVDVRAMNIDFLAGNNYKWMQGFCGVGYGYFGPRAMERMAPQTAGWKSGEDIRALDPQNLRLSRTASRYEFGYPNTPGVYSMGCVAERYKDLGAAAVEERVLALADAMRRQAAGRKGLCVWNDYGPQNRSQIVVLTADETYRLDSEGFESRGIGAAVRDGKPYGARYALRLGLHYYNDFADIERLFEALEEMKAPGTARKA